MHVVLQKAMKFPALPLVVVRSCCVVVHGRFRSRVVCVLLASSTRCLMSEERALVFGFLAETRMSYRY